MLKKISTLGSTVSIFIATFALCCSFSIHDASAANGRRPRPSPTTSSTYSDNFSSYPKGVCYSDGQNFGPWTSQYGGYGCNSVVAVSSGSALSEQPQASTSAGETHASLALGWNVNGNFTYTVSVQTVQQLRTGSAPNPWEVAWVLWNYTDDHHFYYFIPKPNGWELGKEDPAYPGAQRFLADASSPAFPVGQQYQVQITQSSNTITVWVNGVKIVSYTDTQSPYSSGRIGLYNEDSHVLFQNVKVNLN